MIIKVLGSGCANCVRLEANVNEALAASGIEDATVEKVTDYADIAAYGIMAVLVQYLSAKLGLVTGRSLPELLAVRMGRRTRLSFWLQAEVVAAATDVAEVVGGAIALSLLFHLPLVWGGVITGAVSMVLLSVQSRRGQQPFEFVIMGTLEAEADHGDFHEDHWDTVTGTYDASRAAIKAVEDAGVSLDVVTKELEDEGVESFVEAWEKLLDYVAKAMKR